MNVPYIYSKSLIHIENIFILATIKFSKRRFSSGYRKVVKTNKETKKPHYLKSAYGFLKINMENLIFPTTLSLEIGQCFINRSLYQYL